MMCVWVLFYILSFERLMRVDLIKTVHILDSLINVYVSWTPAKKKKKTVTVISHI